VSPPNQAGILHPTASVLAGATTAGTHAPEVSTDPRFFLLRTELPATEALPPSCLFPIVTGRGGNFPIENGGGSIFTGRGFRLI
jgi:hypothetical protein